MMSQEDYYRLLKVEKSASRDEIKKAYRTLALQYHPDINPDEEAEDHIKKLNQAYSVLADTQQRELYDAYGTVPRGAQSFQQRARGTGRGCRGRGMGRGCGGMGMWQEILRKR